MKMSRFFSLIYLDRKFPFSFVLQYIMVVVIIIICKTS